MKIKTTYWIYPPSKESETFVNELTKTLDFQFGAESANTHKVNKTLCTHMYRYKGNSKELRISAFGADVGTVKLDDNNIIKSIELRETMLCNKGGVYKNNTSFQILDRFIGDELVFDIESVGLIVMPL